MINKILNEKTSVLYQARYCAQKDLNIAVCINRSLKRLEYPFSMDNYENYKQISFTKERM